MTISEAPLHSILKVSSFDSDGPGELTDIQSRLMLLGFIHGEKIIIKKKAPIFQEPILVEVRGRMIALTKNEASMVTVEVQA